MGRREEERLEIKGYVNYPVLPTGEENDQEWSTQQETYFMLHYGSSNKISLKLVMEVLPVGPTKILDLGANGTGLVKLLLTWGHDAYGADLPYLAERARQERPEMANRFFDCNLENDQIPQVGKEGYDLIFAFGVIEHLRNSHLFFMKCARALRLLGVLYMVTCNSKTVSAAEEPVHVRHFMREELDEMARKAGFRVEKITSSSKTNLIGTFRKRSENEDRDDKP